MTFIYIIKNTEWAQCSQRTKNINYTRVKYDETFYGRHFTLTQAVVTIYKILKAMTFRVPFLKHFFRKTMYREMLKNTNGIMT